MQARFLDKIGVEIEGRYTQDGYSRLCSVAPTYQADVGSDGSVRRVSGFHSVEVRTHPGSPREVLKQLVDMYPDQTGDDCGMHVHVSFQDATLVSTLNTPEFFAYFRSRWEAFIREHNLTPNGQLARRLAGRNDYTMPNADHEASHARFGRVDRYRQVNFSAWHKYKTVEFRLLPMFRHARIGVAAVWNLVSLLNDWFNSEGQVLPAFADVSAGLSRGEDPMANVGEVVTYRVQDEFTAPVVLNLPAAESIVEPGPVPDGHRRVVLQDADYHRMIELITRAA